MHISIRSSEEKSLRFLSGSISGLEVARHVTKRATSRSKSILKNGTPVEHVKSHHVHVI
jgi:hypothetical protein